MNKLENVISNLAILRTWCAVNPDYGIGLSVNDCKKVVAWLDDALELLKAQKEQEQREYEAAVEMQEYCERYEPTYNPEDGSM